MTRFGRFRSARRIDKTRRTSSMKAGWVGLSRVHARTRRASRTLSGVTGVIALGLPTVLGGCSSYVPRPLNPAVELAALREPVGLDRLVIEPAPRTTEGEAQPVFDSSDGLDESELVAL